MAGNAQVVDILRVEGVMAQGFGLSPKIVMRDRRISIEAKSIYCYLASYAGGGNQAFPSRDMMLADLGIAKNRYYKHLRLLIEHDYIRVERTKAEGNLYGKNIYTLVSQPNPQVKVLSETLDEKVNTKTIETKSDGQSAGNARKPQKHLGTASPKVKKSDARNPEEGLSAIAELKDRLQIDLIAEQLPQQKAVVQELFLAIEDMAASDQVKIGGAMKQKEAINALVDKLTPDHIRLVANTLFHNKQKLVNRKAYIQTCIANSIFDINNGIPSTTDSASPVKKSREADEEKAKKAIMAQQYEAFPELKSIDHDLNRLGVTMSKAVLSGNELDQKRLQSEKGSLLARREDIVQTHGLQSV